MIWKAVPATAPLFLQAAGEVAGVLAVVENAVDVGNACVRTDEDVVELVEVEIHGYGFVFTVTALACFFDAAEIEERFEEVSEWHKEEIFKLIHKFIRRDVLRVCTCW